MRAVMNQNTNSNHEDWQERLDAAVQQAAENHDKYLRALAESENMRKRMERLCEDRVWQETKRLLTYLVELEDQLHEALQYADPDDPLGEGIRITYEQLQRALDQEGAEAVPAVGETFDPSIHEAVEMADKGQGRPNEVTVEYRKGYLLDGRLLRPARVQVNREE
jgi:molecular chaperone GrpE